MVIFTMINSNFLYDYYLSIKFLNFNMKNC